jgi:hypothetical protein
VKLPLRQPRKFLLRIPTATAHIGTLHSQPLLESDQMTTDREMQDVVVTSTQGEDVVELGEVSMETKGGAGQNVFDGGPGWWF